MYKFLKFAPAFLAISLSVSASNAYGWHGKTHKYLAQKSIEYLDGNESGTFFKKYIDDLLEGSVEADRHWGNTKHHITFDEDGNIKYDVAAISAEDMGEEAVGIVHEARRRGEITEKDKEKFAFLCGNVAHIISDMHAFHVIWGEDQSVHGKYEKVVDDTITIIEDGDFISEEFDVNFDGVLREDIDPYRGVIEVAEASYFGKGSILPAKEIENKMSTEETVTGGGIWRKDVKRSTKMIMRKAANVAAEVLENLYRKAFNGLLEEEVRIASQD